MNITAMTNQYLGLSSLQSGTSTTASTSSTAANKAYTQAAARLEQDRQTTTAQISTYGQVKSNFARVQDSSKALAATQSTTSASTLQKNLETFVSTYNSARSSAASTTTGTASLAARDLQRTLSSDSARSDLKSLGISQNADGSLTFDATALASSLQSNATTVANAASRIGNTTAQSATRALSDTGSIGTSLNRLNARETAIESRQADQQKMLAAAQQQVSETSAQLTNALSGISSYNRIFSM
ncbi:hypothetical protein [Propionivibrio dicarboxylicus]|uniref:Flagellar hook-associated protein 2 C-terminus n=1 Tax=Propionivibrio dicarboxylicus TaxID=83767 RepID=A0A1G8MNQ8_9RHOO|nr:hypothetical protein [Propionivibrio dicarboxylicus]SDI69554.1 hypothetical protein SAMN05660652_03880 [Propionivibrio dicarboxylicus]